MSNRYYKSQFRYSFEVKAVDLFASVSFGATGAPTLDAKNSVGVKSVARNSAGDYTFILQDAYKKLRGVDVIIDTSGNAGAVPAAPMHYMKASSPAASGGGTVELVFGAASGASGAFVATDPASGEAALFHFYFNDSSVDL